MSLQAGWKAWHPASYLVSLHDIVIIDGALTTPQDDISRWTARRVYLHPHIHFQYNQSKGIVYSYPLPLKKRFTTSPCESYPAPSLTVRSPRSTDSKRYQYDHWIHCQIIRRSSSHAGFHSAQDGQSINQSCSSSTKASSTTASSRPHTSGIRHGLGRRLESWRRES